MKKMFSLTAIILSALLLLPLTALKGEQKNIAVLSPSTTVSKDEDTFRLCNTETEKVEKISAKDYIFGVVAAEMPALYEAEALKAQAVAAYTYALYKKDTNKLKDYDITDSHLSDQSYITLEEAKTRWGDNAPSYIEKIEKAIQDVENYVITYQGQPILAVYHAISFGKTEDAKNVWGKEYPYLKTVDSYGDKLCKDYISTLTVSETDVKEKLKLTDGNPLGDIIRTDSGTVKSIKIYDTEISGNTIRDLFSLRSSNFEVTYNESNFNFTVYGYGHSVGMSQNGADYMAKQGADFKQILSHYYKDCNIEKLK